MKLCKRCNEQKPLSLFSPRADAKDGLAYWCTPCKTAATTASPRRKQVVEAYRNRNKALCAERVARSVAKDPARYKEKAREIAARRLKEQPDALHAYRREAYRKNSVTHIVSQRIRRQRTRVLPPWITPAHTAEMQGFYRFCQLFPAFEVDHIVPLRGKHVSGLHVPLNLQVLTVRANRQKGATFEV